MVELLEAEPLWKKCITCGNEWTKLSKGRKCPMCDPTLCMPPKIEKVQKEDTTFKEEVKNKNSEYFNA